MRAALALLLVACTADPPSDGDGSTGGSSTSASTSTSNSTSTGDDDPDASSSSTGPAESSSSTTSDDGPGSSTGHECTLADECRLHVDCPLPEAQCVDCACVGGIGCAQWGDGAWGECFADGVVDTTVCEARDAQCLPDGSEDPLYATCIFPGCVEACDCPQPPRGFDERVVCGDVANNGGAVLECYISCERDAPCPDGWSCAQELYCVVGEPVLGPWEDCSEGGVCPPTDGGDDGLCVFGTTGAVCGTDGCVDFADCPDAPATGTAVPQCADVDADFNPECHLDCGDGRTCPDGMQCELDLFCVWP